MEPGKFLGVHNEEQRKLLLEATDTAKQCWATDIKQAALLGKGGTGSEIAKKIKALEQIEEQLGENID